MKLERAEKCSSRIRRTSQQTNKHSCSSRLLGFPVSPGPSPCFPFSDNDTGTGTQNQRGKINL